MVTAATVPRAGQTQDCSPAQVSACVWNCLFQVHQGGHELPALSTSLCVIELTAEIDT